MEKKDKVFELVAAEEKRQAETLMLIPSENYASAAVRETMGSVFANKYAEGYPGKRYYQGNAVVDEMERLCQDRAKILFGVPQVNVQPLSGAPANLAILKALKDTTSSDTSLGARSNKNVQLSQLLQMGGHLSMGQSASITSEYMRAVHYGLTNEGEIDWEELEELAIKYKPRVIWSGGTAYTRIFQWKRYAEIAEKTGAYFVADISHIGGLVAGGAHPSPVPYAHVVMTTTHKTLRGPRGAMIMVTEAGLAKDKDLGGKIDKAVFPGVQGGPHMENVAALAVALGEAGNDEFKEYAGQIVKNAQVLAGELVKMKYDVIGRGTENHMIWLDLTNKGIDGWTAAWALEAAGIIANRQTVPTEKRSAYYPSGLRLGTPAVTTRGMKEPEMKQIGKWINQAVSICQSTVGKEFANIGNKDKEKDQTARKEFKKVIQSNSGLAEIREEVRQLCRKFPVPM